MHEEELAKEVLGNAPRTHTPRELLHHTKDLPLRAGRSFLWTVYLVESYR